jgi:hypothetical protein
MAEKRFSAATVAAVLIALGTGLAVVWALFLPMFLAPDEDTHYDYALTLYSAGRPVAASENQVGRDTHPVVEYLMNATHARQQRLDRNVGADPGYGTPAYYRKLDRAAPAIDRQAFHDGRIDPAPYISKVYPIGYYALVAAAIAATAQVAHDSVVAQFFTARFVSVILLIPTLIFTWLSLRELSLGPRRALLVLACIALLPLSSWTAAGVQPDNLAYFFVAAALYVALRLREAPSDLALQAWLGLLFAGLIAVKQHYFAAVVVATVAMLATRLPLKRHPLAAARCAALLAIPAAASYVATRAFLQPAAGGVCQLEPGLAVARAHGASAVIAFLLNGLGTAFANTFLNGTGLQSFWLYFTAYRDAPITIVTPWITGALLDVASAFSLVLLVLFLLRLMQVARRLAAVARRRSLGSALRVATGNVLINGYLAFFAIIYAFETYVGGYIPLQGRYWLPFVAGLWLITIDCAPRALPAPLARKFGTFVSTALLGFVLVAAAFSLPSLYARFYANATPLSAADETLADVRVSRAGGDLVFAGYAIDRRNAVAVSRTVLRLDGRRELATTAVPDPAAQCDLEKTVLSSGFEARIARADLVHGSHDVEIFVKVPWWPTLLDTGVRERFTLTGPDPVR